MAGIYVHIPFCRKACHYCNFHFSTGTGNMQQMMDAICKEAEMRSGYINENISTIYFGGGTPSLLSPAQLQQILHCLRTNFNTADAVELTLEANPDDITKEALQQWKVAGINRLSIGVQSFFDDDLAWMNRAHNAKQSFESIELAQAAGFSNITLDIIYGTHTLSDEKLQENLHKAFQFNIPHLSCYALTVETGTALHKMIAQKKLPATDDEKQSRQFLQLMQAMQDAGYEHYEISNFAKPGMRSRHNSSYWSGSHYIGLGPSAHSYNGSSRQWNIASNALYIQSIEIGTLPCETETLSPTQKINECIMTSLRTIEGLSLQQLEQLSNGQTAEKIFESAQKFISNGLMVHKENYLRLTMQGKLFADGIAGEMFLV